MYALNASTHLLWSYARILGVFLACRGEWGGLHRLELQRVCAECQHRRILWSFATRSYVESSPVVANGVVYVTSDDGKLYALNASTGAELWSYTTGNFFEGSPAVANGVVYFGSVDNNVYALNANTGAKLWSYPAFVISTPAVANGVVYIGSSDGNLYALNAGAAAVEGYAAGGGAPAVANGVVYVGCSDGLCALNASTGAKLWSYDAGDRWRAHPQ